MADAIPGLLDRLSGDGAEDQRQAARQLGDLARTLAQQSPADLPQLEPAVPLLVGLLSTNSLDSHVAAARALARLSRAAPDLAAAVGRSGAAPALAEMLRSATGGEAQGTAAEALVGLRLSHAGRQAAAEAGADEAVVNCWRNSDHEMVRYALQMMLCSDLLEALHQTAAAVEDEGEEAQQAQPALAAQEGAARIKDLIDAGASPADLFYKLLIFQFERMPANAGLLAQLMRKAAEMGGLQGPGVEEGARRFLNELDDLSVDVPKAPVLMGEALGGLVAGGGADLAVIAEHIRTADANPDEIWEGEDTMLVGGGGAAKTIGALLHRLAAETGEEAANEAWQATGEQLVSFLPQPDRGDEYELSRLVEQYGLGFLQGCTDLAPLG